MNRRFVSQLFSLGPEALARLEDRLEAHVRRLAGDIGERNMWTYPALDEAARYVAEALEDTGYGVRRQEYRIAGLTAANLEVERRGSRDAEGIVIVGAHYDSVVGSPGANDNGSGVAALVEIARLLAPHDTARTVRFVAFVNEEPPFYRTNQMGSQVYARRCREQNERIEAMLCLETIGCYSDEKGSQYYPFPLSFFYPGTGNFIGIVGNLSSRGLVRRVRAAFKTASGFPCESVSAPGWLTGIGWSDHWSFWKQGYPAVMFTDTALFRYPYYHTAEDTVEKVDYARLAQVAAGVAGSVAVLAGG